MPYRLFANAPAQTTIPLAITSGAASVVGASTAAFPVPAAGQQMTLTFLDSGNPAFDKNNPLATPFAYAYCTGNNTGTNTLSGLTWNVGGTTAHNFFAGATVAYTILADDIVAAMPQKLGEQTLGGLATAFPAIAVPSSPVFRTLKVSGYVQGNGATVDIGLQFNGDTVANYSYLQMFNIGGGPAGGAAVITTSALIAQAVSGSSCTFEATIVGPTIATMTNRPVTARCSSAGLALVRDSYWNQSAAITSIVVVGTVNMIAGSFIEVIAYP